MKEKDNASGEKRGRGRPAYLPHEQKFVGVRLPRDLIDKIEARKIKISDAIRNALDKVYR